MLFRSDFFSLHIIPLIVPNRLIDCPVQGQAGHSLSDKKMLPAFMLSSLRERARIFPDAAHDLCFRGQGPKKRLPLFRKHYNYITTCPLQEVACPKRMWNAPMNRERRRDSRPQSLNLLDFVVVDEKGRHGEYTMARTLNVSKGGMLHLLFQILVKMKTFYLVKIGRAHV